MEKSTSGEHCQLESAFLRRYGSKIGRKHPSRDVIFSGQHLLKKKPTIITSHDVLEPLKQVLSASRDVIISGQIWGSKLQRVFTLGEGCWLPIKV